MIVLYLLGVLLVIEPITSGPIEHIEYANKQKRLVQYLRNYGYLDQSQTNNPNSVTSAVKKLQNYAQISESGVGDDETFKFIGQPRCGFPDVIDKHDKRFSAYMPWTKRRFTYHIGFINPSLTISQVRSSLQSAFGKWATHANLTFTEVFNPSVADIIIYFASKDHGDGNAFDGPSNVLAHAYFPQNGDIHYDNDETWTNGGAKGIDFFSVSLHEIGHSLGLYHSTVLDAVMYPTYNRWANLTADDIAGIKSLYP